MKYRATEITVGAFVLVGLALVIAGIFTIRGLGWTGLDEYHARYRNAGGIEVGTAVKFNGVLRGRIKEIVIDAEDPTRVRVNFVVRRGTPVTTRSIAKITRADLLGEPYIDLRFSESPTGTAAGMAPAGDPLPPGSEVVAGDAFDLQATLDHAQDALASLSDLAALLKGQLETVVKSTQRLLDAAEDLLSPTNREQIALALEHAEDAMRQVDEILTGNRARLDSIVVHANETSVEMARLSRRLGTAVDDLLPRTTALLDETRGSLEDVRKVLASADHVLNGVDMRQVADVLENIDTASRNLSDLSRDLKDRPYRLIRAEKPPLARFPVGAPAPANTP